ncbi:NAD-dependent epimerase/dehydratase family protein [Leptospira fletcheri]|uniref:NAD-dependent epimerase/dehydratase family protein n=1 Tax=Leptospira fletcheri TaxID=2484981 RepID=A0A4R9GDV7_9LEPT|nr:NAD-dependent epimerase/dehydratase family protein [Leptospira fletcheri]TGK09933.1 NAD-dependent epimerase/dehydratase family protein [Leptospira fletcheri]
MKIVVTGTTGFVGKCLLPKLKDAGFEVLPISSKRLAEGDLSELNGELSWSSEKIYAILHLGGRAHVIHEKDSDPAAAFRRANVDTTKILAEAAVRNGIPRFVYVSSIKALGESSNEEPLTAEDLPKPKDDYGRTKWEAEELLKEISRSSSLKFTILRPPLIVGKGAKGNLDRLVSLVRTGIPLPFSGIRNKRSMVGVRNFCDAIVFTLKNSKTENGLFLVSDFSLSTPELFRLFSESLGIPSRLFYFPPSWMIFAGRLFGFRGIVDRLFGSLVLDATPLLSLGWNPAVPISEEIRALCSETPQERIS